MNLSWEKYKLPIAVLVLAILVIVIVMINKGSKILSLPVITSTPVPTETPSGLGSELYDEVSNPLQNVPETNPFETKTNPYSDVYKNPFR